MQNLNDLFKSIFSGIQSSLKRINSKIKKLDTDIKNIDIPTSLPNPNQITFTGAVNTSYDGSSPKTVNVPTKLPNPKALTFTGAVRASYNGSNGVSVNIPDASGKMDRYNPTGIGSFSLNRKAGTVVGAKSHAEGSNTTASGEGSHAEGVITNASGEYSHAEGGSTTASGYYSHAEGGNTTASGQYSHAEGTYTKASGEGSHAEGYNTKPSGSCSHAEGSSTTASGYNSHAEGLSTTAASSEQHVQGKFNIEDSPGVYADIIGNGTSLAKRSNAATVDWHGNAWYAGDVYVGSTSGTNKDEGSKKLATEEYVDNSVPEIPTQLPNPQSLTFTGAAEGTYDGSSALTVEIPSAPEIPTQLPNPQSLTFTGAVTGSYDGSASLTVEIPSLDDIVPAPSSADNGKFLGCKGGKAEWLPVEASGGGDKWELINEFTIPEGAEESNRLSLTKDSNGNDFVLKKALLLSNFPPYTGESTIPNFSFASINGIISGNTAEVPIGYTSVWPAPSKTGDRGCAYFVDVSGIFWIEKALKTDISKLRSNGERIFANTNQQNNIDKEWMAIPNVIGTIREIGGTAMLIYPGCWFALYGVRA